MKVIPKEKKQEVVIDQDSDTFVCCLKTNKPCSRETIRYNLMQAMLFISLNLIFIGIIATICIQGYMYQNSNYTKTEIAVVIGLSTLYIECVVIFPIVASLCIKKPLWPLIVCDIVYLVIQALFMLATLLNTK